MSAEQNGPPKDGAVGKPLDRADGRLKVTGGARYAVEWPAENLAYGVLVGSTVASGRIADVDTTAADRAPGVLAVVTHRNRPKLEPVVDAQGGPPSREQVESASRKLPLQSDEVRFNNEYVALVVAETLEQARHAGELIRFAYAPATPATRMEAERAKARPPKSVARDKADSSRGDVAAADAAGVVRVEAVYRTPSETHNPMEPHATTAVWEGDKLTVYDATQYTYGVRHALATTFGIPEENVRTVSKFVGGGFGSKGTVWPHVTLAAVAARVARRPVRLAVTRDQMFANVGHRSETEQHVTLAAAKDGRLTFVEHSGLTYTSTFDEFAEPFSKPTHMMYASDAFRASQRIVSLNVGTPTYMRAPGEASGMFALESALDELAEKLKMDPIDLRVLNHADVDPESKLPWSTKSLKECYRIGAETFGWSKRSATPRANRDGRYLVGHGMASSVYPVNHMPSSARVRIRKDGTAVAESSTHEIGTGVVTILAQIAADALGLPVERVEARTGDTNLPRAMVSGGSSTTMSVGSSVDGAAKDAVAKLAEIARADAKSPLYNAPAENVVAANGRLSLKDAPSRGETFEAILSRAGKDEIEGAHDTAWDEKHKTHSSHSFGAQFVEVRVDPDFGEVRVSRVTGVFGVGRAMNMKTLSSQLSGGIVWGLGMALMEETLYDPNTARVVNADLGEYHVPVNADVPDIDVRVVDEFDPHASPVGAKGAGEIGIVGTAAAVANAIFHATGKRVREFPITLDKLL